MAEPPGAGGGNAGDPRTKGGLYGGGAPPPPPANTRKSTSEKTFFNAFMKAHPAMQKYADAIWRAAGRYGSITPTELAAVLFAESGGNKGAASKVGALGLAQIYDNTANATNANGVPFFRADHNISDADKQDAGFSILYAAWRLSGQKAAHPDSIDNVWIDGYNPNYRNEKGYNQHYISQYLPKNYPASTGGSTAADTAGRGADVTAVSQGLKDPWVVGVGSNGKIRVSYGTEPPKNAVTYDGTPIRASEFKGLKRQLDTYFRSYTGGAADNATVLNYVKKGWSPYSLTVALSQKKGFSNSPIYKKLVPGFRQAAKDVMPQGSAIPEKLIKSAIVNGWDEHTLTAVLRQQGDYVKSNEFKGSTATLLNVHQSIMGVPDEKAMNGVKEAALAGWAPDQYAAWLRSQDAYVNSPEYQTKTLNFLSALGLITGQQAVLKKGANAPNVNPNPAGFGPLPNDPRLAGQTGLSNPEDTVATYG